MISEKTFFWDYGSLIGNEKSTREMMREEILVKVYYAMVDRNGTVHAIHNRREAIEYQLEELKSSGSPSGENSSLVLCELVPWLTYEQIPLEQRDGYPPVTPITDAEPKFMVEGPNGPLECVANIHARRLEHILDQYLSIHDKWQAAMAKYVQPKSWAIKPEEVEKYILELLAARGQDKTLITELQEKLKQLEA